MEFEGQEPETFLHPNSTLARLFLKNPARLKCLLEDIERQLGRDPNFYLAAIYRDLAALVASQEDSGTLEEIIGNGSE